MEKNNSNKALPSTFVGDGKQRDVSCGELVELENMFNKQVKMFNIGFECEGERQEALFDFIQQYIDGNDDPQIAHKENQSP